MKKHFGVRLGLGVRVWYYFVMGTNSPHSPVLPGDSYAARFEDEVMVTPWGHRVRLGRGLEVS